MRVPTRIVAETSRRRTRTHNALPRKTNSRHRWLSRFAWSTSTPVSGNRRGTRNRTSNNRTPALPRTSARGNLRRWPRTVGRQTQSSLTPPVWAQKQHAIKITNVSDSAMVTMPNSPNKTRSFLGSGPTRSSSTVANVFSRQTS